MKKRDIFGDLFGFAKLGDNDQIDRRRVRPSEILDHRAGPIPAHHPVRNRPAAGAERGHLQGRDRSDAHGEGQFVNLDHRLIAPG